MERETLERHLSEDRIPFSSVLGMYVLRFRVPNGTYADRLQRQWATNPFWLTLHPAAHREQKERLNLGPNAFNQTVVGTGSMSIEFAIFWWLLQSLPSNMSETGIEFDCGGAVGVFPSAGSTYSCFTQAVQKAGRKGDVPGRSININWKISSYEEQASDA